ncbi:hypothetical protein ACIF8T_27395 [Streptomyces sp. NPDC085946]|uniref:hypothetical protein n=1 Tax=Streptomyces sp. NPDC085946 TaxID=3365744 RepID=UPI0037D1D60B
MRSGRTRLAWVTTAAGALLALTATGPATAAAQPVTAPPAAVVQSATEDQGLQVLDVRSSASGLEAPATARPGPASFRVSTTDPASGWISLVRPEPGVTFESFRSSLVKMISTVGPDIVAGSAEMRQKAKLLGGTVIHPNLPASFTTTLAPGTYWLFDYLHVQGENPRHTVLQVGGTALTGAVPVPTATLTGKMIDGRPRWILDGTVRAGRPLLLRNAMTEGRYIEAVLFRLADDVTEQDVRDYIADFGDTGTFPDYTGPLALDQGTGGLPLTAGESTLLELTLQPGRYVVVDFLKDAKDGSSLIKDGHWKIFEVE